MKTTTVRRLRWLHRSLGLLLFVQLLFWVGGGLIMSLLQIDAVRGADRAAPPQAVDLSHHAGQLLPMAALLEQHPGTLESAELRSLLGAPVWYLRYADRRLLLDARSGELLSPLSEARARELASADMGSPAQIVEVRWQDTATTEIRGRELPLWRIQFDDDRDTAIYISATTAPQLPVAAVRFRLDAAHHGLQRARSHQPPAAADQRGDRVGLRAQRAADAGGALAPELSRATRTCCAAAAAAC